MLYESKHFIHFSFILIKVWFEHCTIMNKYLIPVFTILSLVFLTTEVSAQEKLLTVKQQEKDFEQFMKFLEAHPDPYTHIKKKTFNDKIKKVKNSFTEPISVLEYFRRVSSVISLVRDGHSSVYFPRDFLKSVIKEQGALPFKFHLTNDNKLYVIKKHDGNEVPIGSEIIKINGISIDSFLTIIDPYISYEKLPFRNTVIDNNLDKYVLLAFGKINPISVDYFSTDTTTISLKTIPYKLWEKEMKAEEDHETGDVKMAKNEPYAYEKIKDGIGVLTIYSFSTSDLATYQIFLRKSFRQIAKDSIHSLIIDVRDNFGGWPKISSELFHYISNGFFKTQAKSEVRISHAYKRNYFDLYPGLRNATINIPQRKHYLDIKGILESPVNTYITEEAFFNEKPDRKAFEFTGDCYLLQNRDSYSAASSFASTFQCYLMGKIIGEETGGTKVFRANPIHTELGRSRIRLVMSTTKKYTACFNPDKEFVGVVPNIAFSPTILDLCHDADTQLYYTVRLIMKKRKLLQKQLEESGN